MTVLVSHVVYTGIEAVRLSGLTNMLDCPRVAELADEMGFHQAAYWVRDNRDLYARAIFHGFEVIPSPEPDTVTEPGGEPRRPNP